MLCANQGQPLILRASRAAVAYLNIAKRLLGQKAPYENTISATRCGREVSTMNIALMSHDRKKS